MTKLEFSKLQNDLMNFWLDDLCYDFKLKEIICPNCEQYVLPNYKCNKCNGIIIKSNWFSRLFDSSFNDLSPWAKTLFNRYKNKSENKYYELLHKLFLVYAKKFLGIIDNHHLGEIAELFEFSSYLKSHPTNSKHLHSQFQIASIYLYSYAYMTLTVNVKDKDIEGLINEFQPSEFYYLYKLFHKYDRLHEYATLFLQNHATSYQNVIDKKRLEKVKGILINKYHSSTEIVNSHRWFTGDYLNATPFSATGNKINLNELEYLNHMDWIQKIVFHPTEMFATKILISDLHIIIPDLYSYVDMSHIINEEYFRPIFEMHCQSACDNCFRGILGKSLESISVFQSVKSVLSLDEVSYRMMNGTCGFCESKSTLLIWDGGNLNKKNLKQTQTIDS